MDEELGYLQKGEVCEGEAVSLYSIRISHLTSNFTCDFLWLFLIREVPWNPDSTWTNGRDGRWTQNFFYSCPPSPNRKAWDHITLGWLIHLLLMIWAQKGWPPNISRKKTDWLVCLGGDWRVLSSNELPKASLLCSLALISFLYSFLRGYCCNTFPSKTSIVSLFSPRKFFGVSLLFKRSSSTFSPHWNSAMLHLGKNGNLKQNSHHAFFFFLRFLPPKYMYFSILLHSSPKLLLLNRGTHRSWYFRLSNLPKQMVPSGKLCKVLGVWFCLVLPSLLGVSDDKSTNQFPSS